MGAGVGCNPSPELQLQPVLLGRGQDGPLTPNAPHVGRTRSKVVFYLNSRILRTTEREDRGVFVSMVWSGRVNFSGGNEEGASSSALGCISRRFLDHKHARHLVMNAFSVASGGDE